MHRSTRTLFSFASLGIALAVACGPQPIEVPEEDGDNDDNNNSGGVSGTGATQGGYAGVYSYAGSYGTGAAPTGGFSGTPATGGFAGVAGTPAGGSFPSGGAASGGTAGTFPTGGMAGVGVSGAAGSAAGTPSSGGSGSTTMCDAAFVAGPDGFVKAPGTTGCWHGYAYSGGDTGSMLTTMTSFATCGMPCALRVAGTLGAATEANMYAGVVYLGFNVNQTAGASAVGTIAPTGTGLQITYTKVSGPATIRVQIQAGASRWCADLTASPATIPYTTFNTMCWAPASGVAYAKQPIEAVQLVAPGAMTAGPVNMTLVSVKDM